MTIDARRLLRMALTGALTGVALWSATLGAQAPRMTLSPRARTSVQAIVSHITGTAITMDEPPKPVTGLKVRLRAQSGQTVALTDLDDQGEFSFAVEEPGTYYVELLDQRGRVVAVEDIGETAVTVARGRVSTTILRMPRPLLGGLWGPAATKVLGAAAASGIGAVVAGPPTSPER
jgi:hypothetical protein